MVSHGVNGRTVLHCCTCGKHKLKILGEEGNNILGQRVNEWTEQEKSGQYIISPQVLLVTICISKYR